MKPQVINLKQKLTLFQEQWSPKIVAQMNNYHFKIAKIQGDFITHSHPETDETYIVISGQMQIEFEDGLVELQSGEMIVVPRDIPHKPIATQECHILMVEPAGTLNTGDTDSDRRISDLEWV